MREALEERVAWLESWYNEEEGENGDKLKDGEWEDDGSWSVGGDGWGWGDASGWGDGWEPSAPGWGSVTEESGDEAVDTKDISNEVV